MNKNKEIALKQQVMQLTQAKRFDDAKKIAIKLAKSLPKDVEVWFALGQLQERLGEFKSSAESYCKACQSRSPLFSKAITKAVDICFKHKLFELGIAPAKELVKLTPDSAGAHFKLGAFWHHLSFFLQAEDSLIRALEIEPDNIMILNHLGLSYTRLGQPERAMSFFERSKKEGDYSEVYCLSLTTYNYMDGIPEDKIFNEHRDFGIILENRYPEIEVFPDFKKNKSRRIRLGYVSPDFRGHAVSYFFKALIENYSNDVFEVYCYSDVNSPDKFTDLVMRQSDHWRDCLQMSDEQLYRKIRSDEIDILVDLAAYNGNHSFRLEVFARKAAPIQVTYLGYPNTTGLSRMDYRITDDWSDPKDSVENWYTEELMCLPGGFLCFSPVFDAPEVSVLPAKLNAGSVCFGSFNYFHKITPNQIKLWASVLKAVSGSTLFVKTKVLQEKALRERIWNMLENQGVTKGRVELSPWLPDKSSHLGSYGKIDIHLDSYPYNGTTTTCEALWQGVPTITRAGESHRSRVGLSILTQVGLTDFIAFSEQEYIDIAVKKAADLGALGELRARLRDQVANSLLMDQARFISEIEQSYHQMWAELSA